MKTILLTGVAGGVASCLVREYLHRGYHVYGADIHESDAVRETLAEAGGNYEFRITDVSDTASVRGLADWLRERTDHLDILFNAAGVLYPKSERLLEEFDIDAALPMYSINALGPLRVVQACVDLLRKGEEKLLVNMSS